MEFLDSRIRCFMFFFKRTVYHSCSPRSRIVAVVRFCVFQAPAPTGRTQDSLTRPTFGWKRSTEELEKSRRDLSNRLIEVIETRKLEEPERWEAVTALAQLGTPV